MTPERCTWKHVDEDADIYDVTCSGLVMVQSPPIDDEPCPYCDRPVDFVFAPRKDAGHDA